MATSIKRLVHGQVTIQGEQHTRLSGDEMLHISVRDALRHDQDWIELGSKSIPLKREQRFPIDYRCYYDPNQTQMKFEEIKTIPGALTVSARIEKNERILFINNTDRSLAGKCDIQLVKME